MSNDETTPVGPTPGEWRVCDRSPADVLCHHPAYRHPVLVAVGCGHGRAEQEANARHVARAVGRLPRRTVVTLCGSTRFGDAYRDALREETLAGRMVFSVGLLGHAEGIDMSGPVKAALDELHLAKIDASDEILVLNVGGYVGESTRREIAHAVATGKRVRYLEPPQEGAKP